MIFPHFIPSSVGSRMASIFVQPRALLVVESRSLVAQLLHERANLIHPSIASCVDAVVIGVVVIPIVIGDQALELFPIRLDHGLPNREHVMDSCRVGTTVDRRQLSLKLSKLTVTGITEELFLAANVLRTATVALLEPRKLFQLLDPSSALLVHRSCQLLPGIGLALVSLAAALDGFLTESCALRLGQLLVILEVIALAIDSDEIEKLTEGVPVHSLSPLSLICYEYSILPEGFEPISKRFGLQLYWIL